MKSVSKAQTRFLAEEMTDRNEEKDCRSMIGWLKPKQNSEFLKALTRVKKSQGRWKCRKIKQMIRQSLTRSTKKQQDQLTNTCIICLLNKWESCG